MAEPCGLESPKVKIKCVSNCDETVSAFSVLCVFISLVTILADLTTVILVFAEYCNRSYFCWAIATMIFIILPNILTNIFSLRWLTMDHKTSFRHWITHCFLFGVVERYIFFLHKVFWCKSFSEVFTVKKYLVQRNDLNLLHFLYAFSGTVPQIILQTYAVITLEGNYHTRVFSLCASFTSVSWACATYIYSLTAADNEQFQWLSVLLKTVWHFGMLVSRLAAILLFTVIFGMWTLIPMGIHWAAMTFWIVTQKTTFCPNKVEETLYNVVMGFIYCFCYINLREGHTRYRLMMFYTLMITQNFGSLLLYILISTVDDQKKIWSVVSTICIVTGTIIGICSMLLYYRWFHAKGPIVWKNDNNDIELNNKVMVNNTQQNGNKKSNCLQHVRSFKSLHKDRLQIDNTRNLSESVQVEIETADKKILLDHWIARSGTPTFVSAPIGNNSMDVSGIDFYTVENTPQSINMVHIDESLAQGTTKNNSKTKKKQICSPTELNLKLSSLENLESSIDELTSSNLNLQKRRGICSSDELNEDFQNLNLENNNLHNEDYNKSTKNDHCSETSHDTDGSNKKTSSDSIDMDLDLSFSDINSSDINTFNENIVQKLCLSALKNIKVGNQDADIENIQRIALDILKEMYAKKGKNKSSSTVLLSATKRDVHTPTEMLSVHDYENICAVNIAREAWGLRSWNGYSDIENWLHDGSVFRDRRRDTLTSGSTEISSCISHELKNYILSAPPFPSKRSPTYSNVYIKFDKNGQEDYVNTAMCSSDETFLAKPCVIDNKDTSQLEPIIEELDDLGDIDTSIKKRLNSERSLVATIDEIRKATITNSPRNVYHRREHNWESPQLNTSTKLTTNLKQALWKEPSKFNSSNIMESLPEKENMFNISHGSKFDPKKELNIPVCPTYMDMNMPHRIATNQNKCVRRKQKSNNLKTHVKKMNNKPDDNHDIFNKEIDFLWQLVSENSHPVTSIEDLSANQITSSLQSLILKDGPSVPAVNVIALNKNLNAKKATRGRPRRKFSILRERFEPRPNKSSDEEVLYQYSEILNFQQSEQSSSTVVKVKNKFDSMGESSLQNHKQLNTFGSEASNYASSSKAAIGSKNIKEKRSQFMKQVLTPPKFNTKLKHKF